MLRVRSVDNIYPRNSDSRGSEICASLIFGVDNLVGSLTLEIRGVVPLRFLSK